jgi:hypothetical protein
MFLVRSSGKSCLFDIRERYAVEESLFAFANGKDINRAIARLIKTGAD